MSSAWIQSAMWVACLTCLALHAEPYAHALPVCRADPVCNSTSYHAKTSSTCLPCNSASSPFTGSVGGYKCTQPISNSARNTCGEQQPRHHCARPGSAPARTIIFSEHRAASSLPVQPLSPCTRLHAWWRPSQYVAYDEICLVFISMARCRRSGRRPGRTHAAAVALPDLLPVLPGRQHGGASNRRSGLVQVLGQLCVRQAGYVGCRGDC